MAQDLTPVRLREVLSYDPISGVFRWRVSQGSVVAGAVAGSPTRGYTKIKIDRRLHSAHRLAWLYIYGKWPAQEIDHINGDKADNRLANLRDVDRLMNTQNQRASRTAGLLGTHRRKDAWIAQIKAAGCTKYLGIFKTEVAAHNAYLLAKRQLHEGCTL